MLLQKRAHWILILRKKRLNEPACTPSCVHTDLMKPSNDSLFHVSFKPILSWKLRATRVHSAHFISEAGMLTVFAPSRAFQEIPWAPIRISVKRGLEHGYQQTSSAFLTLGLTPMLLTVPDIAVFGGRHILLDGWSSKREEPKQSPNIDYPLSHHDVQRNDF